MSEYNVALNTVVLSLCKQIAKENPACPIGMFMLTDPSCKTYSTAYADQQCATDKAIPPVRLLDMVAPRYIVTQCDQQDRSVPEAKDLTFTDVPAALSKSLECAAKYAR